MKGLKITKDREAEKKTIIRICIEPKKNNLKIKKFLEKIYN